MMKEPQEKVPMKEPDKEASHQKEPMNGPHKEVSHEKGPVKESGGKEPKRALRKQKIGTVVSHKMEKSIVIEVRRKVKHPKYGKFVGKTSRFMAHDEKNEGAVGDTVRISETRPLSKNKRWRLVDIIEKAK